jgi:zinc/manganese transport system substrate-binding protein
MKKLILIITVLFSGLGLSQIKVVTTTTIIYDLVKQVGQEKVKVDYLCRGDQDPHFLEIMPSYMLKLRKADLVFKTGLDLEKWLPQLIDGSRNDKLKLIDLSEEVDKKEVPTKKLDASYGDIHPYGNPHYYLDPSAAKIMVKEIYDALINESPEDEAYFKKNMNNYLTQLDAKINSWNSEMAKVKGKPIVFFHSSWIYFADHFGIRTAGFVEPKPGIPPTPSHNAEIIQLVKSAGIKAIIMENYYDDSAPNQLARITGAKVVKVPVGVFGVSGVDSYIQMIDYIVNSITQNV